MGVPFVIFAALFVFVWVGVIMARQSRGKTRIDLVPWIERWALLPLLYLAAAGLVLSIAVHAASLLGFSVKDSIWLHFGVFVVCVPGVVLSKRNGKKDIFSALPKWAGALIGVF